MARLWSRNPATPEGKYLVVRRDGTVPAWPSFVLGAADPAAPMALRAYAAHASEYGMDAEYVADLYGRADEFEAWRVANGDGDPDAPRHRVDDPATVALMRTGHGS